MEKLQLLNSTEERQRRLEELPEVHADPKMDPSYKSDEDVRESENQKQGTLHLYWDVNSPPLSYLHLFLH